MNKIFTLLASLLLYTINADAQIDEGFENTGGIPYYQSQGWSFTGGGWDNTSKVTQVGSIAIIPTTSTPSSSGNSNTAQITTPYVDFSKGGTISFNYKLSSKLGPKAQRTFTISLLNANNVSTTLTSFTIGSSVSHTVIQASPIIQVPFNSSTQRVIIYFTGDGDGNTGMYVDNISATPTANITLPIKLLSFSGTVLNSKAQLQWSVADNHTGDRFEIEKSSDGKSFRVSAVLFTTPEVGNESYSYNESNPLENAIYYRIKIVNKDNSSSYTKVVFLKNTVANTSEEISLVQNPIQSALAFSFTASASSPAKVNLYNMAGVKVYSFTITIQKGTNKIVEPVDNRIAKGTYILEVSSTTQRRPVKVTK
jgi:hypothetical protein